MSTTVNKTRKYALQAPPARDNIAILVGVRQFTFVALDQESCIDGGFPRFGPLTNIVSALH